MPAPRLCSRPSWASLAPPEHARVRAASHASPFLRKGRREAAGKGSFNNRGEDRRTLSLMTSASSEHALIENIRLMLAHHTLAQFASDRILLMAVERSFEIMSEASRYIPGDLNGAEKKSTGRSSPISATACAAPITASTRSFSGTSPRTTWSRSSVLSNASSSAAIRLVEVAADQPS